MTRIHNNEVNNIYECNLLYYIINLPLLILLLLVSNLIIVYSLIVDSRSYVEKLAPMAQSSMFKRRTFLAFKIIHKIVYRSQYLQYCPSTSYNRTLFSFPSMLL